LDCQFKIRYPHIISHFTHLNILTGKNSLAEFRGKWFLDEVVFLFCSICGTHICRGVENSEIIAVNVLNLKKGTNKPITVKFYDPRVKPFPLHSGLLQPKKTFTPDSAQQLYGDPLTIKKVNQKNNKPYDLQQSGNSKIRKKVNNFVKPSQNSLNLNDQQTEISKTTFQPASRPNLSISSQSGLPALLLAYSQLSRNNPRPKPSKGDYTKNEEVDYEQETALILNDRQFVTQYGSPKKNTKTRLGYFFSRLVTRLK